MAATRRGGDEMTPSTQPAPLAFSTAFGLLMVTAAAIHTNRAGVVAIGVAVVALLAGLRYRPAATLSVLSAIAAIVLSVPPPLFAALSGLSAAAYLVIRHAAGAGVVTTTRPTVIAMVTFTLIGIGATSVPLHLPWLPLVAPPAVVVIFLLAAWPFLRGQRINLLESGHTRAG
jgi:hypothetical protein